MVALGRFDRYAPYVRLRGGMIRVGPFGEHYFAALRWIAEQFRDDPTVIEGWLYGKQEFDEPVFLRQYWRQRVGFTYVSLPADPSVLYD